jgi:hypothetical protein
VASQSASTGGDGNQVHPLLPPVASIRRNVNRHPSTRIFGSHVFLDNGRSRKQAARFQDLLQQPSHAYFTGRANAGYACVTTNPKSPLVSMATILSSPLSDTRRCLICQRLARPAVSSRPRQNSQEIIRCFPIAVHFADPIVSLPPEASLSQGRLPIKSAPGDNSPDTGLIPECWWHGSCYVIDLTVGWSFGEPQVVTGDRVG